MESDWTYTFANPLTSYVNGVWKAETFGEFRRKLHRLENESLAGGYLRWPCKSSELSSFVSVSISLSACNLQPDNSDNPGTCPKHVIDKPVSAEWSRLHFLPDQQTSGPADQQSNGLPDGAYPWKTVNLMAGFVRTQRHSIADIKACCTFNQVLPKGSLAHHPCNRMSPPHGIRIFLPIPGRNRH